MSWYNKLLYYQTEGGKEVVMYDHNGTRYPLKFKGINLVGFETGFFMLMDFWEKDQNNWTSGGGETFDSMLDQIQKLGFNALRIPVTAIFLLEKLNQPVQHLGKQNSYLNGKTYGEMLHILLAKCCERNLFVMLDFHKCEHDIEEMFSHKYPEAKVMECHKILCYQYVNNYNCVFALQLKNEPHCKDIGSWGKPNSTGACWDDGPGHLQWRNIAMRLGNEVLKHSPHIILVVDGISNDSSFDYYCFSYWGSHWREAKRKNSWIWFDKPNKFTISSHPYGPSVAPTKEQFYNPKFPWNMYEYLDECMFFMHKEGHAPMIVTEWGGKSDNENDLKYQYMLADYMKQLNVCSFHWCWSRHSSDTAGVQLLTPNGFDVDWVKMDYINRACPDPTYVNFKDCVNANTQHQTRSLPSSMFQLNLTSNSNPIDSSQSIASTNRSIAFSTDAPEFKFPEKLDSADIYLPMVFKTEYGRINVNKIPIQLAGITWYGMERNYHLDLCQSFTQFQNIINSIKHLGFNYIRIPITLNCIDQNEENTYTDYLIQLVKICQTNGILIGFTLYNFYHGQPMSNNDLWYNEQYSESKIAEILSNFALTLRIYPNVLTIELFAYPSDKCKWNSGQFDNDYVLANERIGNAIQSKNSKILFMVSAPKSDKFQKVYENHVDLAHPHQIVYLQNILEDYPFPLDDGEIYNEGKLKDILQETYGFLIEPKTSPAPLIINIDCSFKTQNHINYTYSMINWFKQNNVSIICDDMKNIVQNLQTRMAIDYFQNYTTKFSFTKKIQNKQIGYQDLDLQEKLKLRVEQGKVIVIPDFIQSKIPNHKNHLFKEIEQIDPRIFNKSLFKHYPDENQIQEQIQSRAINLNDLINDSDNPEIPNIQSRDFDFSQLNNDQHPEDPMEEMKSKLEIKNNILHRWYKSSNETNTLHEVIITNISNETYTDIILELTPEDMIKNIWEINTESSGGSLLLSLSNTYKSQTKFYPGNSYKFGYISQYSTPNLSIKELIKN